MTNNVDRREALKRTALLLGGTISAPTMLGLLNGCTPTEQLSWTPQFFTQEQARLVSSISETIIPGGEVAGAVDVGIPAFIEEIVSKIYSEAQQKSFMDGLANFTTKAKEETGKDFLDLELADKEEFVGKMQLEAFKTYTAEDDEMAESYSDTRKVTFMGSMRELTLVGYCQSEVGATQVLKYEKIPGEYLGCIPYEEVGGVWVNA